MLPACLLSFATGFLSLSIEILWIRLFGYANHSLPQAFAFVLIFYLIGIACGAEAGKRFCNNKFNLWMASGIALSFSSLFDLISPWIYAEFAGTKYQLYFGAALILASSFLKSIVFPIAHHLGTEAADANMGRRVSRVYVSNIFGSTLGPLVTGFILLSTFSTQQCFIICAALTFTAALFCLSAKVKFYYLGFSSACAVFLLFSLWSINPNLLIAKVSPMNELIRRIVENEYGIVVTYHGGKEGDIVTGGNVYDGRTNLDPVINSNGINRLVILNALNDHPANVLMIGLSIGTWLKILSGFPAVANIDVVEINPGYLKAIQDYPPQEIALSDPRVNLYVDDGRRWLKSHADNKYDLIVINTTFHWRAYSSNLLSHEFISLLKQHMKTDAVLAYNTTDSPDAFKTAAAIFNHAYLYQNFVIAADFDWREKLHDEGAKKKLAAIMLDSRPLFPPGSEPVILSFLNLRTRTLDDIEPVLLGFGRHVEIITDRNLISEYKYGKQLWS